MDIVYPTKQEILQSAGKKVADVITPDLKILFCGINPGLYSAAVGHHFARPGNRFWKVLFYSGLTNRLYSPSEGHKLVGLGLGITNLVERSTAAADELTPQELQQGRYMLEEKVIKYKPEMVVFLGIGSYRIAFGKPRAKIGLQSDKLGTARVWVMPNPSGLNAHFQLRDLVKLFQKL